jgi:hypothetical protein
MKNIIIRITDISDIDTSKISVYDLNNRYVDSQGNMYGLRYNRSLRKMEIIKIIRTHEKNAGSFQQKILMKKRSANDSALSDEVTVTGGDTSQRDAPPLYFNPDAFVEKTMELIRTHRERIKGIIMNIRNSNIVPIDNKTESNQLEDIFRNLDIDVIQGVDNLLNYQKELLSYPRSVSYYQAKMDDRGREIIETLASSNKKVIRFIYLSEMLENIRILYKNFEKFLTMLKAFLDELNIEDMKWVTSHEKQSFKDGMISINTTIQEITDLEDELMRLEQYAYDLDHYT